MLLLCSNISVCFLLGTLADSATVSYILLLSLQIVSTRVVLESQKDVQPTVTLCDKKTTTFNHDFVHPPDVDEFLTPLLLW